MHYMQSAISVKRGDPLMRRGERLLPIKESTESGPVSLMSKAWRSAPLLLCLASLFWALNPIVGRAARDLLSPVTIAFWRWVIAFAFVSPFAWRYMRADWPVVRQNWPFLLALGAAGLGLFAYLVYASLQFTTATNNLLLQAAMPIMTLLMPAVIFRDRIPALYFACATLSVAGVGWIVSRGDPVNLTSGMPNIGDLLAIAAVFLYSAYATFLRKAPALHHLTLLAVLFSVGIATLAIPYCLHIMVQGASRIEPAAVAAVLYVGIFPSLLSYALFNRSVELIGSSRAGLYMNLPTLFGVILAVPLLGETFERYHLIGSLMVIASILISRRVKIQN